MPRPPLSRTRIRVAWAIALAVDAIQIPAGATGPVGWLLGFHWAFLPSFLTEGIPYLNLAPFWTLAVALATRGRGDGEFPPPPRLVN